MPHYVVHFKGKGTTKPDALNPQGIKVTGTGEIWVEGERPQRNSGIPNKVVEDCKRAFMKQCGIYHYDGDTPKVTNYPTVWLGRTIR